MGIAFDILQKAVLGYSVLNLENGDHMMYMIKNVDDDIRESGIGQSLKWNQVDKATRI